MNSTLLDAIGQVQTLLGIALIGAGAWLMVRGLWGGRGGKRGLLRSHEPALARAEGWRVVVVGFVAGTLGFASMAGSALLLYLALGIGFVELWEASFVISVWRHSDTDKPRSA